MHRSKKTTDDWVARVVLKIFVMFHCLTVGHWWIISNVFQVAQASRRTARITLSGLTPTRL